MGNIYKDAIDCWGVDLQIQMAIEEMAELTKALIKWVRLGNNPDIHDKVIRRNDIVNEIADVKIMMRQLEYMFGRDDVDNKIIEKTNRLQNMIDKHREEK